MDFLIWITGKETELNKNERKVRVKGIKIILGISQLFKSVCVCVYV